jgi:ribonucleoside-diphosphate reductase alpha chain
MVLYIKKRDGQKALFNADKITNAIKAAFLACQKIIDEKTYDEISLAVVNSLESKYTESSVPSVEHTQDIVELELMRSGHTDVAKSYILYRERHKLAREAKLLNEIKANKLFVITDEKQEVSFNSDYVYAKLNRLSKNLDKIDTEEILDDICKNVYNKMPVTEIDDLVVNTTKAHIEKHYNYSYLSSRMVLDRLYKNTIGVGYGAEALKKEHASNFADYITKGIEIDMLNPELAEKFNLAELGEALNIERDKDFLFLGLQTIVDRYLLRERNPERTIFELPQWLWMRVSMGLALLEDDPTKRAIQFYEQLSEMNLVCSTPTLFNSGTTHSQMSSCYLNTVDDSMEGIFKNYGDNAQLSKWAGGIGTNWTAVRSKNAFIHGTNGKSQGVIPFLKIYNDIALAVNQGGKRKGAMAAYLEIWHADVEEFMELKKNTGDERRRTHDIHTAVFIPDLFMKRVKERKDWTLFSPDTVPELHDAYGRKFNELFEHYESLNLAGAKTIPAVDLWRKLLTMLFETGHPWITFKDACNVRSPQDHVGVVRNSNLCTEITLNTSQEETAVCNLASINLSKMITDGKLDETKVRATASVAMRMLDNVVDNNFYPTKESKVSNMRHRPVGLGVMGYQDALYQIKIDFDSDENVEFADRSMELISHASILASANLAKERGAYESFKGSKWDRGLMPIDTVDLLAKERGEEIKVPRDAHCDWNEVRAAVKEFGIRNSNCMAIAPTATISNIAGTVPCVEPTYKNIYMKENLSGNFVVINKYLVDALDEVGLWNKTTLAKIKIQNGSVLDVDDIPLDLRHRFKETFEIDSEWVLKAAARRAKWIDQSASTNIFLKTTSGRILADTYMNAWEMGLKTTYYLRTLAASQVTKTVELEQQASVPQKEEELVASAQQFKACSIDDPDCEACQ